MQGHPAMLDHIFAPLTPEQRAKLGQQFEADAARAAAHIRTQQRLRFEVPMESPVADWAGAL